MKRSKDRKEREGGRERKREGERKGENTLYIIIPSIGHQLLNYQTIVFELQYFLKNIYTSLSFS